MEDKGSALLQSQIFTRYSTRMDLRWGEGQEGQMGPVVWEMFNTRSQRPHIRYDTGTREVLNPAALLGLYTHCLGKVSGQSVTFRFLKATGFSN